MISPLAAGALNLLSAGIAVGIVRPLYQWRYNKPHPQSTAEIASEVAVVFVIAPLATILIFAGLVLISLVTLGLLGLVAPAMSSSLEAFVGPRRIGPLDIPECAALAIYLGYWSYGVWQLVMCDVPDDDPAT